jgi:enamine deaminase RidA (YjgF/YER057c/UK114 family)
LDLKFARWGRCENEANFKSTTLALPTSEEPAMSSIQIINPEALGTPSGPYSQIARVKAQEFLFIAGQVAGNAAGGIVGEGDIAAQCRQVFANLEAALASQGANFSNVVSLTTYVVGSQNLAAFMQARKDEFARRYPNGQFPTNTLLVIERLARPELLLEVSAIAAL